MQNSAGGESLNIGSNIKNHRESLSLTQKQLADRVHVNNTMICQIERGSKTPNITLVIAIADALGCSIEDLIRE